MSINTGEIQSSVSDPSFIFFPFVLSDIPVQVYMGEMHLAVTAIPLLFESFVFFFSVFWCHLLNFY